VLTLQFSSAGHNALLLLSSALSIKLGLSRLSVFFGGETEPVANGNSPSTLRYVTFSTFGRRNGLYTPLALSSYLSTPKFFCLVITYI